MGGRVSRFLRWGCLGEEEDSLQDRGIHRQKLARLSLRHARHVQDQGNLHQSTKKSTERRRIIISSCQNEGFLIKGVIEIEFSLTLYIPLKANGSFSQIGK